MIGAHGLRQRTPMSVEYFIHFNGCTAGENPYRIPNHQQRNDRSHWAYPGHFRGQSGSSAFQKGFDGFIESYMLVLRRSSRGASRERHLMSFSAANFNSHLFATIMPAACFFKRPVRISGRPFNTFNVASRV
jgi:hypothetical protein